MVRRHVARTPAHTHRGPGVADADVGEAHAVHAPAHLGPDREPVRTVAGDVVDGDVGRGVTRATWPGTRCRGVAVDAALHGHAVVAAAVVRVHELCVLARPRVEPVWRGLVR